jgi:small-conductance mechanosensitive channel
MFHLSPETNIKNAKDILMEVMKNNKKVLKKPEPLVVVKKSCRLLYGNQTMRKN